MCLNEDVTFFCQFTKKALELELVYNCMKALKTTEVLRNSTNPPGCSLIIEFGNQVHGHYTVNTARSPSNCFVSKKFETLEILYSEVRPQSEWKAMDIPKSEKRTVTRFTQLRNPLLLTEVAFLYSCCLAAVPLSLFGIDFHNQFTTSFSTDTNKSGYGISRNRSLPKHLKFTI